MHVPTEAQESLIAWYRRSARAFPWRETRDPYRILVSEIMLQQTQAERVVPKYLAFLEQFPTLQDLAAAAPADVIRAWSGLGYNRRALNLQRACRAIVEERGGVVPDAVDELRRLPGIGPYTAGAVACFAFEQDVGFVDTNIARVLHRVVAGPDVPAARLNDRQIVEIAAEAVPKGRGYLWNQALMEVGATLCRARSATCLVCPLREWCAAAPTIQTLLATAPRRSGTPAARFEHTSRYARGRIVALLRETEETGLTEREIGAALEIVQAVWSAAEIGQFLRDLLDEGLLEVVPEPALRTAEESPSYDQRETERTPRYRLPL